MFKLATCISVLLVLTPDVLAQRKPKAPEPVEMTVRQVNDRRGGQFFERMSLVVELPRIAAKDVAAARVLLSSASDDTGKSLIGDDRDEPPLESPRGIGWDGEGEEPTVLSFNLGTPARAASSVKEVRGEVELYMPSKDPNSVALIPKFLASRGKALTHKSLKSNGVEISLVSEQQYEAEKKRLGEAKRKEMLADGYPEDSIASILESFFEYFPVPDANDVVVRIKDPKNVLQEIAYVDSSGETRRVSMREDEGFTFLSSWEGPPEENFALRVSMKTAKTMMKYPFVLTNVALP
ncbi:MAG TPA: hypothetical protein VMS12_09630 [Thermoanaerobaculia bacterium]|nr:hypothetical protein [Thermoanaerobaculia bacterium]